MTVANPAAGEIPQEDRRDCPYFGLAYYDESSARWFFGREAEIGRIITNLRASRLTLVHADSGVGKSSLLRAGVAARLREMALESVSRARRVRLVPIVFSKWTDDPLSALIAAICDAVTPFLAEPSLELSHNSLSDAIATAARAVNGRLLIILDQFEEYFLYSASENPPHRLADELARAINDIDLPANFVIAIREDAYAGLGDLFKGRLDNVYGNYLNVGYLTREEGAEAIERPLLEVYNRQPGVTPKEIDPRLVSAVLDQVRAHGESGDPAADGHTNGDGDGQVATPLLQLVMQKLWEREESPTILRLETLERLEGVEHIVDTHLATALNKLDESGRDVAIDALNHLVTPSGGKIAESIPDLAQRTSHTEAALAAVLDLLVKERILRPVAPPPGRTQRFRRYEIFHDVLAAAINRAIARRQEERLELERAAAEEQARAERDRARRARITAAAAGILALAALALGLVALLAWRSAVADRNTAQSRRLAAASEQAATQNPELATLLALAAVKVHGTDEAEAALRDALPRLHQTATLSPSAPPRSVAFNADGSRIVTASADGSITIWDASSRAHLKSFGGPTGLERAALDAGGSRVIAVYEDGTGRVWNARTGRIEGILASPDGNGLASGAFSPDGTRIVTAGGDGSARIWDSRTYRQLAVAKEATKGHVLLSVVYSPDGREILGASSSGDAVIWDARTGTRLRTLPGQYGLLDAEWTRDGTRIITASGGGDATVWNAHTGTKLRSITPVAADGSSPTLWAASFSPNAKQAITAESDGIVHIWNAATGRLVRRLTPSGVGTIVSAAYSRDGTKVAAAAADGTLTVWDSSSGKRIGTLRQPPARDSLRAAIFSPDGTLAATGSRFGTVTLWKRGSKGRPKWGVLTAIAIPENDAINAIAFSPGGSTVATASESGRVWLWAVPSGEPAGEIDNAGSQKINSVQFDPANPSWIVTASDDECARIFDTTTDKQVGRDMCQNGWGMGAAAFSPNGDIIVTGSKGGDAQAWNATTQQPMGGTFVNSGSPITSVAFGGKGQIVFATGSTAQVYNAKSHQFVSGVTEPGTNTLRAATFSPDGRTLLTGDTNALGRIWDASSQQQLITLGGHDGPIETVAFDRAGTQVITASSDGTAKIWNPQPVEQKTLLPGNVDLITVAFDRANPSLLVTVGSDASRATMTLWDLRHPSHSIASVNEPSQPGTATSAEFSDDGRFVVTTGGTEQARIYSVADLVRLGSRAKPLGVLDASLHGSKCAQNTGTFISGFDSAIFSHDDSLVATADHNGDACIWNAATHQPTKLMEEPAGGTGGLSGAGEGSAPVRWVQFSRDGTRLLTASDDGTARIWSVSTGRPVQVLTEPSREAINDAWFNADDSRVVTASDAGTVGIWDAKTGVELHQLVVPDHSQVFNANFSPDGRWIVTCGGSGHIFSVSGQRLTDFQYGSELSDCEFSPDGRSIAAVGGGGVTRIFSTELAGKLSQIESIARARVTRQLTPAEKKQYGIS